MKRYEMRKAGHYPIAVPLANGKYILFTEAQAIVKQAIQALTPFADIDVSAAMSGHDTVGYARGGHLIYAGHVRSAREALAALDEFGEGE